MDNVLSKQELLRKIQELAFCAVDLNLFLDTHPNNQQALQDYRYVLSNVDKLKDLYNKNFGSFMNFSEASAEGNYWSWVSEEEKWPWENK